MQDNFTDNNENKNRSGGAKRYAAWIIAAVLIAAATAFSVAALCLALTHVCPQPETIIKYEYDGERFAALSEKYKYNAVELRTASLYGSALVYTFDGEDMYLFTNYHVAGASASGLRARFYGKNSYYAENLIEVVGYNVEYDVALLKTRVYPQGEYVDIRKEGAVSDVTRTGEEILCLGNNLGSGIQAQNGIVSSPSLVKNPMNTGSAADTVAVIGACAPFNSGDSGAMVLDMKGNLVGMETWRIPERADGGSVWDTCYLTPAPIMTALYDVLVPHGRSGEAAFPYVILGEGDYGSLYIQDIRTTFKFEDFLLKVESVDALGTRYLQTGDVIKKFGSVTVTPCNYPSIIGELFKYSSSGSGGALKLTVTRGSTEAEITLTELREVTAA